MGKQHFVGKSSFEISPNELHIFRLGYLTIVYSNLMEDNERSLSVYILDDHLWTKEIARMESTETKTIPRKGIKFLKSKVIKVINTNIKASSRPQGWATEHVNRNEWSNILLSDESRFSVHPNNRRDRGSRNNPAFVHESVRFGGGGVLVYGGISIDGRTDLYIIRDGPLTARRYRDEILRPIVVPYAAAIRDDFILMDDN
ncbi:transposable element Tcb2 transposase [Trichonephila clavipes]|nr:transposable element Tcb2 transposase [Trichonephila clavipes]